MVGVSQKAWESLDTKNRERVVMASVNANIAIVTAQHDDADELHFDHIPTTTTSLK